MSDFANKMVFDQSEVQSANQVEEKVKEFVTNLVTIYESSIEEYHRRLKDSINKSSKVSDFFNGFIPIDKEIGVGNGVCHMLGLAVLQEVISTLGSSHNEKYLKETIPQLYKFQKAPDEVRKELIKSGVHIFRSFEYQFVRVVSDKSWKGAMRKLAHDAVNRTISCFKETEEEFSAKSITKGILSGQSRIYKYSSSEGHTLEANDSISWNTAELFDKVGLVTIGDDGAHKYYKKRNGESNTVAYGHRLLFEWELMDLNNYEEETRHEEEYKYVLKPKNGVLEKIIFNDINNNTVKQGDEYIKQIEQDNQDNSDRIEKLICDNYEYLETYLEQNAFRIKQRFDSINEKFKDGTREGKQIVESKPEGFEDIRERMEKLSNIVIPITKQINIRSIRGEEEKPLYFGIQNLVKIFIERESPICKVINHAILNERKVAVICGLPGVGKTELAISYVHQYCKEYHFNIWINAATEENMKLSFSTLLKELGSKTPDSDEEEKSIESIVEEVYCHDRLSGKTSLFIFDNAQNYIAIEKIMPPKFPNNYTKIYILITSNNSKEWQCPKWNIIVKELRSFNKREAMKFVKTALKVHDNLESENINKLSESLNNVPLALRQAIVFIKKVNEMAGDSNFKVNNYLELYEKTPENLMSYAAEKNIKSVFKTLEHLLSKIKDDEKYGPKVPDMLNIMAYLSPSNIPEEIFIGQFADTEEELKSICLLLKQYSIISFVIQKGKIMLNIHEVVQRVLLIKQKTEKLEEEVLEKTLTILKHYIVDRFSAERCIPHIKSVWDHASKYGNLINTFIVNDLDDTTVYTSYFKHLTPLHYAAQNKDLEIITALLNKNYTPDAVTKSGVTALHIAVTNDNLEIVNILLDKGADVNIQENIYDLTPLHYAIKNNNLEIITALLNKNAKLDAITKTGVTVLHIAVTNGNLEIVNILLERGADVNIQENFDHLTPLHEAVENNYLEIITALLNKNPKLDAVTKYGVTALHTAVRNGNLEIVNVLLEKEADVNIQKNSDHLTPLHDAVHNNSLEIITALLNRNAKLDATTKKGVTALHIAVRNRYMEVVNVLLQKGADVNIQEKFDHLTPLHDAVENNNLEIITALINKNAKLDAVTKKGLTALHTAVRNGNLEIVNILLEKGADVNIQEKFDHLTPLHDAVEDNNLEIIIALLNKNVKLDALTRRGVTALHTAVRNDYLEIANVLIQKGADVNIQEKLYNFTPLHYATQNNNLEIFTALLNKNAKLDKTALRIAVKNEYLEILSILAEKEADDKC